MASLRSLLISLGALAISSCGGASGPPRDSSVTDADGDGSAQDGSTSEECEGKPLGTPCGDDHDSTCDAPDACNGLGECLPNHAPVDTPCGDSGESECDAPDTCDGYGECVPNYAPAETTCGSPIASECDPIDRCDGEGTCVALLAEDGTPCGEPTSGECTSGGCVPIAAP